MNESRITEIEIKSAYLEDLVEALNVMVSDHQKQIKCLEQTCQVLNEKIKNSIEYDGNNQENQIPPHY